MKILAVHNVRDDNKKTSAVDIWRIWRPIRELRQHVDWQIDEQPTFIPGIEKYKDAKEFTAEELDKAAAHLGQYDIIWSTYFSNPTFYALLRAVNARYGTKFVLDVDDDMFGIKPDNPVWLKLSHENVYHMQCMIRDADYITTTTERLAHVIRERRPDKDPDSVYVLPNYIADDYKREPYDNGDTIEVGYFGGSSHYYDLEKSGAIKAVERLMHEYKNVHFTAVGMPIEGYLPRGRYTYNPGAQGHGWIKDVFPTLNFDIALAPIDDSRFSQCKSNIKWQEATRMGAAVIASNVGPYSDLHNGVDAMLVNNREEDWYKALKKLVDSAKQRKILLDNARKELQMWRLEVNWPHHKQVFESIKNGKSKIVLV